MSLSKTKNRHDIYLKIAIVVSILLLDLNISAAIHQDKSFNGANQTPPPIYASMTWSQDSGFSLVVDKITTTEDTVGWANFTNAINQTGWSYLEIKTHEQFADKIQAYTAGYLEGYVTSEILFMQWQNTVEGYCDWIGENVCKKISDYLQENTLWIKKKIHQHRRGTHFHDHHDKYTKYDANYYDNETIKNGNPYWHHVSLFYDQLQGLEDGYDAKIKDQTKINGPDKLPSRIPHGDIFFMNIFGDLEDLTEVFKISDEAENSTLKNTRKKYEKVMGSGSCSALIKMLKGNTDLFVSHVTWNSYQSMLRVLKKYSMGLHFTDKLNHNYRLVPGQHITFSGYPGVIYSGDDFNAISPSGLAVMETTIGNSNKDLWKYVKPKGQILEGVRSTIANRLAHSGSRWAHIFSRYNSGTYNNQWMVIDYKKFKPGMSLKGKKGLLWILEQLPGHIHMEDKTDILGAKGYWPSYNTPYFKDIFRLSGGPEKVKKYGNWFSYDKTPRALIFKRDQKNVKDLNSMSKLMRYNNYKNDPLSQCNCTPPYSAENAISARCDLNPKDGVYPFGSLGHRSHGGTDMKLTNYEMFKQLEFIAVSSPTYDSLPPFQWTKADFANDTPHNGHPDLWNFQPIQHKWSVT